MSVCVCCLFFFAEFNYNFGVCVTATAIFSHFGLTPEHQWWHHVFCFNVIFNMDHNLCTWNRTYISMCMSVCRCLIATNFIDVCVRWLLARCGVVIQNLDSVLGGIGVKSHHIRRGWVWWQRNCWQGLHWNRPHVFINVNIMTQITTKRECGLKKASVFLLSEKIFKDQNKL